MAMKPTDQEIGTLYREGGTAEPSGALDRNILAAARAAVDPQPAPAGWWSRWRLPLQATVAVCLVAMLAVMLGHHEPSVPTVPPLAMNQAGPPSESRLAAPAPASNDRAAEAPQARARSEAKPTAAAPAPAPAPAAAPAQPARPAAPAPQIASRESALAAAPAGNTVTAEMESAVPLAKSETGAAPAAKAAARLAADQSMSPKDWLDSIQALIDQNRLDDARKRLEAFTRAYPGETVPAAMQARLKTTLEGGNAKPP